MDTPPNNDDSENFRLTKEWLQGRSHSELVDIILELRDRAPKPTTVFPPDVVVSTLRSLMTEDRSAEVTEFRYLPSAPARWHLNDPKLTWRIVMVPADPGHEPLGLEIYDDVFIGREVEGIIPDLDLDAYGGTEAGLSRQHALIRPQHEQLLLIDLDSTNGTYCNGNKLGDFDKYAIKDKDIISFGTLHFLVRVIDKPDK